METLDVDKLLEKWYTDRNRLRNESILAETKFERAAFDACANKITDFINDLHTLQITK